MDEWLEWVYVMRFMVDAYFNRVFAIENKDEHICIRIENWELYTIFFLRQMVIVAVSHHLVRSNWM